MKTNGRIRELLATPCYNDIEYGHRVIWPLLDFLGIPPEARRPQFQIENPFGNGLSEIEEDPLAEPFLASGQYDLVIGNSPGNNEYSGTNREEIARQWQRRFGHVEGGLMDHHCFIRRAVELARPNGGRVCLLVPEGLLARDNRGLPALRLALARQCELRLVITLPRVFKNNNARMAIVCCAHESPKRIAKSCWLKCARGGAIWTARSTRRICMANWKASSIAVDWAGRGRKQPHELQAVARTRDHLECDLHD